MEKIIIALILGLLCISVTSATMVDRAFFCNLEGYPEDTIEESIMLTSTLSADRVGHWETFYKEVEGDDEKMNITSWIEIEPKDYTLKPDESKSFRLIIKIPSTAEQGLYGATSEDANVKGHYGERRTYIRFKDADAEAVRAGVGSVVWTGFRIPVSVNVLGTPEKPSPFEGITDAIKSNILSIALLAVIVVLLVILLRRRKT